MRYDNEEPAGARHCDGYGASLLRARPLIASTRAVISRPLAAGAG